MRTWGLLLSRTGIACCAVVGLFMVAATPALASGNGATSFTQTFHNATQVMPSNNPCSGATGTLTLTYNGVFHVTVNRAGDFWVTGTMTGTFLFVPDDASQPTFTGHFTSWFGTSANNHNSVDHFILNIHGTGSDGSTLTFHEVGHFSVSASGMTVSFDNPTCG